MKYDSITTILSKKDCPQIVIVGIVNSYGELLCGKRRDNGKWTCPGGHTDQGEDITDAACREVKEETGIEIHYPALISSKVIISHRTGKEFVVHMFMKKIMSQSATNKNDPDEEVSQWKWIPLLKGQEELQAVNRHAKDDMILEYLGGCFES